MEPTTSSATPLSPNASRAEAFLFAEGGSLTLRRLAVLLTVPQEELVPILDELAAHLEGSGLALVRTDDEVALAASADASESLREAYAHDLSRDIGEAGLEVLAVILYRGPSTRAHIDYIRGVNTSTTIRTLLSRGLVERSGNPSDGREYVYRASPALLAHLGVTRSEELPDYASIRGELATFEAIHESASSRE